MGIEGHRDRGIEKRERNRYEKEGEKVEHSRGSNVCVSGKVDKKRTETGNRSKAKEIKKRKTQREHLPAKQYPSLLVLLQ